MSSDNSESGGSSAISPEVVEALILGRRSVRAFLNTPVPERTVSEILRIAAWAPSGTNAQPWRVRVLTGQRRIDLTKAIMSCRRIDPVPPPCEYPYPPAQIEPYQSRRRKVGFDLYSLLGIERGDHTRMTEQLERNYHFFGAPVGLIFTLDRNLGLGVFIELGMFMQTVMLAARGFGLSTCAQAALANYHAVIRDELSIPANEMVMCGMALGYADKSHITGSFQTERALVADFATFYGDVTA